jgi:hypothetical protein
MARARFANPAATLGRRCKLPNSTRCSVVTETRQRPVRSAMSASAYAET